MLVWEWGHLGSLGLGEWIHFSALDTPKKGLGPSLPCPQLQPLPSLEKGPLPDPFRLPIPGDSGQSGTGLSQDGGAPGSKVSIL